MAGDGAPQVVIRPEETADAAAVRELVVAAFGRPAEADLVGRLRAHPGTRALVAVADGELAGCIVFSAVAPPAPHGHLVMEGLAPLAIAPFWQGQGIGTLLMDRGLADCAARGVDAVVVLGHPDYYARFGFSAAQLRGISCKWVVPEDAFMVKELRPGALAGVRGRVEYLPEFDEV